MKVLQGYCWACSLRLALSLARGAKPSELREELIDLAEVHGDLRLIGGTVGLA
jgi:hypothetical protein